MSRLVLKSGNTISVLSVLDEHRKCLSQTPSLMVQDVAKDGGTACWPPSEGVLIQWVGITRSYI